jgi:alanine racemase
VIRLDELLALPGARLLHESLAGFSGLAYDSRLAQPGELFLALRTERGDGHRFIADALARGCAGVLCERPPQALPSPATVVAVPDVLAAIQAWAAARLRACAPDVIAVTGSVGKTSVTRATARLLEGAVPTFRSRRSFNSLLGLPIALADLAPEHRVAVLEMGCDRFGEMARLTQLFPPRIAVVTSVGATHLERFGTLDGVAREKAGLVAALPPAAAGGVAVLNADDPRVLAMRRETRAAILTFGLGAPDLSAREPRLGLDGTSFLVEYAGRSMAARVALLGMQGLYVALAAIGAALAWGLPIDEAVARLELLEPAPGRMRPLAGRAGATLVDDSFNASPPALDAALAALRRLPARRRVAVLGDMSDLGEQAVALHCELGARAVFLDQLVTLGDLAAELAASARAAGLAPERISVTHTVADALAAVRAGLGPGDLVLVKGSAAVRMERVVAGLLAEPGQAGRLLVRQEPAWETVRIAEPGRPTWLDVDLEAIAQNTRLLALRAGQARLMAVLKADAYGHGALRVARTVLANGAAALAVATLGEARDLRQGGVGAPILVLGYTPPWHAHEALALDVACTLFDAVAARAFSLAAESLGRRMPVHLKVDTGMARLGLAPDEAPVFLAWLRELPGIAVEGIYTHLSDADNPDLSFSQLQLARFDATLAAIGGLGLALAPAHAANSAALLRLPQARYQWVRPGIALYGLAPAPDLPLPPGFRPALSWKTRLARVAELPPGTPVGYGRAYHTPARRRIATIPVGYADGFRRQPHWQEVLVGGRRCPLVGRVCMDYAMLDVTGVSDVRVGDEVVLLGVQGGDTISADEVAGWLGTSAYEVVSMIMPRVPRHALPLSRPLGEEPRG